MSILIKGVEMPKNCDECICNYDWHCMVTLKNLFFVDSTKRLDDCPLIEVPKHGRLIDADELKASIQSSDTDEYQILSTKQLHDQLDKWIDGRETIIEAEEE